MGHLAVEAIRAERRLYERLAAVVRGLTDDQLTCPSGAPGWTIAQVLGHLAAGAERQVATVCAAVAGSSRPPDADAPERSRWATRSPREQADGYLQAGQRLNDAYAELGVAQRDDLQVFLPFLPRPAGVDVVTGLRLNEAALHGWDVEVAVDPHAAIPGDVAALLVELYFGPLAFLVARTARPQNLAHAPAHLAVRTSSPSGTLGLAIDRTVRLTDAPTRPDAELTMPLEALPRLLSGRLREANGHVQVRGDVSLDDLRRVFPGY